MKPAMSKHGPDAVSLVFGGLFLAIVTWWLVARTVDVNVSNVGWLVGAGLIALGVVGLWTSLWPGRRHGS
jgi:hypothetical protein